MRPSIITDTSVETQSIIAITRLHPEQIVRIHKHGLQTIKMYDSRALEVQLSKRSVIGPNGDAFGIWHAWRGFMEKWSGWKNWNADHLFNPMRKRRVEEMWEKMRIESPLFPCVRWKGAVWKLFY
jgi:hypothetical protein